MTGTDSSSDEQNSTDTGEEMTVYRNDPTGTFDPHLFAGSAVAVAGGADGEQSERPVSSLCARTTSYGSFHAVDPDDLDAGLEEHSGGLCDVCRDRLEEELQAAGDGEGDDAE